MALSSFIDGLADTSPEAKKARDSFAGNVKDFVVGAARDIPRAGAVVAATLTGIETDDPTKRNKLSRFVFGDEPIKSLKGQNPDIEKTLQQFGVPQNVAKGAAPVVGLFSLGLNLYPGSPGKGALFKKLALEGDEKVVQTILKKEVKSLSDNAVKEIAPQIAKATTRKEVDDILAKALRPSSKALSKEAQTFIKNNPEPAALGTLREYVDALDIDDAAALPEGFKNIDALAATAKKQLQQYGVPTSKLTKPKLANLAEEILNKTGDVPKFRERGYITSVKDKFSGVNATGRYLPKSSVQASIKARNLVNDNIAQARQIIDAGDINQETTVIANELIKKYSDDALKATSPEMKDFLNQQAADVANKFAPTLTDAAQALEAAKMLGRMTPEGQLRFAAGEIARWNMKNPGKQIPGITAEQAGKILEDMKRIEAMPDGWAKSKELYKVQRYVQTLVPTPLWKKMTTIWKAGLLTGIKTSGVNLMANASHSALETVKDAPAAVVDSVASLFTGQRTKTFNVSGAGKGIKEGFARGWDHLKTGFDERNIAEKLDYTKVNFGKGPIAKIFQGYTEAVFRVMGAGDQPFYYGALSRSLADQATAKAINEGFKGKEIARYAQHLIENPTEEMLRYAVADASTAVFQNETYLGKAAGQIQNMPVVGEIVVPFARTPSAVATQILKYTPAGPVQEIFSQIGKRQFDQRRFSEAVGRGLTGTAVLAIGYEMAKKDMISLDRPTTEREQKLWELEGRKPNSILIDGKWRSPIVLGPAGNLLLVAGHFERALQEFGSSTEALAKAMAGSAKSFTEQTFLTGVNSAVDAINDPNKMQSYLENMVGSIVPTLVSDVARATDPLERRPEGAVDRIKSRTPGLRQEVEPKVDVLGNEIERIGNPLEVLADPTRPQEAVSTPVIDEFRRLFDAGYKVSPTLLGDKKGYKILSKEQNTELWKRSGEILQGKLNNLFKDERYQELEDDKKAKLVEQFVEKSKISARAQTVLEITDGLVGNELKEKLSELKKDGLLTRDVFNLYVKIR